jgi:aminodeoxyfutalosine deaminase
MTPVNPRIRIDPWIAALPKVELHVHLEGSMSPSTVATLAAGCGADTRDVWPEGMPERFSFEGFPDFARQFQFGLRVLRTAEAIEAAILALAHDLARQQVRWAEVTSTAFTHLHAGVHPSDYCAALNSGRSRAAAEHGVHLGWVIDIPRDLEQPGQHVTIDFLESKDCPDGVVAIGLGGYEVGFPPEPYKEDFARAKALGLASLPHAGETEGPSSIWGALDVLGAQRIGHGVRCLEDPDLARRLADIGTHLEVCPTSNVLLHVVDSIEAHPIRTLMNAGLSISVNTDDPGMFATDLMTELQLVHDVHGVDGAGLVQLQHAAIRASLMPAALRSTVTAELQAATVS